MTALLKAAENSYGSCIHLLLQAGADVNVKNESGFTPLMLAAQSGCGVGVRLISSQVQNNQREKSYRVYSSDDGQ